MALTSEEREAFLAEPHVAALSVAEGPDRGPLTVPIWYGYEPGGRPWILTEADSRKTKAIEAAGRFTLLVDTVSPRLRYVSVEGTLANVRPGTEQDAKALAERYLPADKVAAFLDFAGENIAAEVVITLQPQRWLSADLTL